MRKKAKLDALPFHQPFLDIDDRHAIARVLASRWLTTGKEATAFEDEFATYVTARHALAVSSCTAALHLALVLAEVGPGDTVIVPTLTFTATAAAVVMAGAQPILADVAPDTLTLSAEAMERVRDARTSAVMPVHYAGNPSGFREVLAMAKELGEMHVIDDAAHAIPASMDGHPIGGTGIGAFATCFSFYPTKPVVAGEAGMLVLRDTALMDRARRLSLHGIDADAYQRSRQGLYHYEVIEHGWKYNLPDLLAALGRSQLGKADALARRRFWIAEAYTKRFLPLVTAGVLQLPVVHDGYQSAWHLYVIQFETERFRAGWDRDRIAVAMKDQGIGTSLHYRPLHRHRFWQQHCATQLHGQDWATLFPHTERAYPRMLSLPIWPGMTDGDVDRVASALESVLAEATR